LKPLALAGAAVAALALSLPSAGLAKPVTVREIARGVKLADPHFSPDGKTIAYVETRADLEADEFRSEIMLADVATKAVRPITRTRHHAGSPRWSPDGTRLAFTAPDADKTLQVYVLPMAGGEALQLTKGKDSVSQFAWSPDGKSIAYAVADPAPELKGEDKFRTGFKVGNDDVTVSEAVRPTHLWLTSSDGMGEARRLTKGDWSLPSSLPPGPPSSPVSWTKDGKSLIYVEQKTPSTGDQPFSRLMVLDVASGKARGVTGETQLEGYPKLSPDGRTIAYWRNRDGAPWKFQDVWLAPFDGGAGKDIGVALDKNVYGTLWAPDGQSMIVGANTGTTVGLWRLKPDGAFTALDLGKMMPANGYWLDIDVGRDGAIAVVGQTAVDPSELYLIPAAGGAPVAITKQNAALADLTLGRAETVVWKGPGGRMLSGVVTYPPDFKAGQKYPLVLFVHGGPSGASREKFGVPEQVFAAQGYVVFEPNYRGGDNDGNAFYASIYKDAGQGPGEDVMSGVEFLKSKGFVDAGRMAVTGWSYGGFMTTWLAGHYPVWKAAVAGAAVTDWVEMYNLSDGNVANAYATGLSPYAPGGMELNRKQSPATMMTRIRAPTLVMTDTGDFRVPAPQSFGLYHALKDNGVPTEFVAYPVGGHFPGDPIRQMDVYNRWTDWLNRWLKADAKDAPQKAD
jgi:dipeptidyl aminopeptidase/acylaminoacyl peptidase